MAPAKRARASFETLALVLGRVILGDADLILQVFTKTHGRISVHARGARRSKKGTSGALEPMHTLRLELVARNSGGIYNLRAASLEQPRTYLISNLEALTAAGRALRWIKKSAPQDTAEPALWKSLQYFLDELNERQSTEHSNGLLALFGLKHLEILGWGLNLNSCVACGKNCPIEKAAWVSPERGGLVCRECGGGPLKLVSLLRQELTRPKEHPQTVLSPAASELAFRLIEAALRAHMGHGDR